MKKLSTRFAAFFALIATSFSLASAAVGAQPCQDMAKAAQAQHHNHGPVPSHSTSDCPHAVLGSACNQVVAAPSTVAFNLVSEVATSALQQFVVFPTASPADPAFPPPRA